MTDIRQMDRDYIANTYARFPLQLVRGKGCTAWDENGKEYIDLGSGIAVNSLATPTKNGSPPSPPS